MNWDDLRFFIELARTGRLSHAGERLGVDHSTVARRIEQLEQATGGALFDSDRSGFRLTDAGHRLLAHAETVENAIARAQEDLSGDASRISGTVRIGTPEGFGTRVLTPRLGRLLDAHPELQVEILALPRFPNLAAREADIVVTLDPPAEGRYVAKKLADFGYGLYASPAYLSRVAPIDALGDLASCDFVGYIDEYLPSQQLRYLDRIVERRQVRIATSGMLAQVEALRAGLGIGVLAHYLAHDTGLLRLLADEAHWPRTFWIVTHADWFRLRRVQAVWNFVREIAAEQHALFDAA